MGTYIVMFKSDTEAYASSFRIEAEDIWHANTKAQEFYNRRWEDNKYEEKLIRVEHLNSITLVE